MLGRLGLPVCLHNATAEEARRWYDFHRPAGDEYARGAFPPSTANTEAALALATAVAEAQAAGLMCAYSGCEVPVWVEADGRVHDFCSRGHASYHHALAGGAPPPTPPAPRAPGPSASPAAPAVSPGYTLPPPTPHRPHYRRRLRHW